MATRFGYAASRSLMAAARSSIRSAAPRAPRLRSPPITTLPTFHRRRLPLTSRWMGELGCLQSMVPLHDVIASARLTSHLSVNTRGCCELSQGILLPRTCPDR
ncbi:hypothetical protein AMTRI_Chr05g66330 [Amborella trichopoda]